jgi:hypothetical protein
MMPASQVATAVDELLSDLDSGASAAGQTGAQAALPQVEDSFAPLDELAVPGAGLDDFEADFTVGFDTIPPGTELALSDSGLLDSGSLDHVLTDSHDFPVSLTDTGSERELTEEDLDALDFSQLAGSAQSASRDTVPPIHDRPAGLARDQPRASGLHRSIESAPLETPTPFSDLSSGDMVDDVEYSIDFGLDADEEPRSRAPSQRKEPQSVPVEPPAPPAQPMMTRRSAPVDLGSIDIRGTGGMSALPQDNFNTGGYTSLPTSDPYPRSGSGLGFKQVLTVVIFLALGVGLYLGGKQMLSKGSIPGANTGPEDVMIEETGLVVADTSMPTLLQLIQGEIEGPEVVEHSDRPLPKMTRIDNITWEERGEETVVIVWGDGAFKPTSTGYLTLNDPSRVVIKLLGVASAYTPEIVNVDLPAIDRIRLGFHVGESYNEIHMVADLAEDDISAQRIDIRGNQLQITFGRAK